MPYQNVEPFSVMSNDSEGQHRHSALQARLKDQIYRNFNNVAKDRKIDV